VAAGRHFVHLQIFEVDEVDLNAIDCIDNALFVAGIEINPETEVMTSIRSGGSPIRTILFSFRISLLSIP